MQSIVLRVALAGAVALVVSLASQAADWPDRAVRVIVPYPPGGPSDIVLRSAGAVMQTSLGHPIVLENKPGAGAASVLRKRPAPHPTATPGSGQPTTSSP